MYSVGQRMLSDEVCRKDVNIAAVSKEIDMCS